MTTAQVYRIAAWASKQSLFATSHLNSSFGVPKCPRPHARLILAHMLHFGQCAHARSEPCWTTIQVILDKKSIICHMSRKRRHTSMMQLLQMSENPHSRQCHDFSVSGVVDYRKKCGCVLQNGRSREGAGGPPSSVKLQTVALFSQTQP